MERDLIVGTLLVSDTRIHSAASLNPLQSSCSKSLRKSLLPILSFPGVVAISSKTILDLSSNGSSRFKSGSPYFVSHTGISKIRIATFLLLRSIWTRWRRFTTLDTALYADSGKQKRRRRLDLRTAGEGDGKGKEDGSAVSALGAAPSQLDVGIWASDGDGGSSNRNDKSGKKRTKDTNKDKAKESQ